MMTSRILRALWTRLSELEREGELSSISFSGAWMDQPPELRATMKDGFDRRHTLVLAAMEITDDMLPGDMPTTTPVPGYLSEEQRLDLARAIPNGAQLAVYDNEVSNLKDSTLKQWLAFLGHPVSEETGRCAVCEPGPDQECNAIMFTTAFTATVIRQLNIMGALRQVRRPLPPEQVIADVVARS